MDFGEMIQSILGNPTFKTIMDTVALIGSVIAVFLHKSSNTKFKTTDVSVTTNTIEVKKLQTEISELKTTNNQLKKQNQVMSEEMEQIIEGLSALGNIISTAFMGSKAISENAKLNMCQYVSKLKDLGFDVKEVVKEVTETTVEIVNEIKEIIEQESKENTEKAEDTKQQSLDLYNQILNESNE
jgi:hypothetical protein